MAQDAELKLKVSLDLGFFRQQLAGLGQAAAGYNLPVKVQFDRRAIQNELNALGASIKKREYRLTIQTNLKAEIDQARKLAQAYADLERGAFSSPQPKQRGSFTKSAFRGMDLADVKKLYKEAANAGLLSYDDTIAKNRRKVEEALYGLGKDSIAGLLNGIDSENEKIKTAAKKLGKDLISSVKTVLGIASPSKEFKKIGEDSGEGFEQGLKIGFGEAGDVGVREIEKLFQRLQKEAKAGSALLQAIMAGAMSGVMQLPGRQRGAGGSIGPMIRQQRAQVRAERQAQAGGMSALMMGMMGGVIPMGGTPRGAGGSISAMIRQQRTAVQAQRQAQAGSLSALMIAMMSGVVPMGGKPRGAGGSIKELIQQERAKIREQNRPLRIESLIAALSSARGNLSPAAGVNQRLATGGAVNPGLLSSGYIGRSALSPRFINYPAGMPPAYATGFIEPTAFGSLAAGTTGRYGMGGAGAFPSSPMMRGGIGAGGGSFIPMQEVAASSNRAKEAISGFIARLKNLADFVAGNQAIPVSSAQQRQAALWANSRPQGNLGSRFVGPSGNVQSYAGNFPVSGMMGPSSPLGRITAQSSMFGAGGPPSQPPGGGGGGRGGFGGFGGLGGFGRAIGGVNLPGAGTIRELGSEFAFATKQVLLFGQAYKLLGFLQSFPGQVGAAVGQLQTFRNTLGAISPTAEEAAASNKLILDLVERYNVPLQSAREGFTKLYASMAPAGFSGDEIRDLFTGITQAAATFGMSADKVDRVNYAFAQMASKGQVMSEELKGQLGDVLPGAMALFAKAAGFEGPKAIQDFSAALEDGAYKGEAMVALLKNVGIVMKQEFGPGAEGAALTFQGIINRMQNSMVLLYESFEPVAVGFLNTVVVPLTSGIKEISDGFNAFFTGTMAQTSGGSAFAQQLQQLKPAFDGIRQNIQDLLPLFDTFGQVAASLGKAFIQLAGNPFVGYLLRIYAAVLPLVGIIKILNLQAIVPMIASVLRAIPAFVAFNAAKLRLITTNKALQLTMQLTGTTAAVTASRIRLMGAALASLVAPAVLIGIGALIERFMMLKGAVDGVRQSTQQMVTSISSMANTGAVKDLRNVAATTRQQIQTFESLRPFVGGGAIGPQQKLTSGAAAKMEEVGLGSFVSRDILGKPYVSDFVNASKIIEERLKGLRKQAGAVQEKLPLAEKVAGDLAKQAQVAQKVTPIPSVDGEGEGKKKKKGKKERESQVPLLELELATTQKMFELEKEIMMARLGENDLELIRLQGLKEQLRFNEQIAKVKLENELPAAEKALQIQRLTKEAELARLQTNFDLEEKILETYKKVNDAVIEIGKQAALELEDKKEYQRLVMEGVLPSAAKITTEVNRQFAIEAEKMKILETQIKDQIALLEAKTSSTKEDEKQLQILRERLKILGGDISGLPELANETVQARIQSGKPTDPSVSARENLEKLREELDLLLSKEALVASSAMSIGEAFSKSFKDAITGASSAQEALAGFFQSVASSFADMAAQMIQKMIQIYILDQFLNILSPAKKIVPGVDVPVSQMPAGMAFANGGIAPGGFRAFANGGIVTGPTMGLVGEGRYNEAVVPLPDGKSIPVDLGKSTGDSGVNIVVNVDAKGTNVQGDNGMGRQLGAAVSAAVQAELIKQKRPGGLLA